MASTLRLCKKLLKELKIAHPEVQYSLVSYTRTIDLDRVSLVPRPLMKGGGGGGGGVWERD